MSSGGLSTRPVLEPPARRARRGRKRTDTRLPLSSRSPSLLRPPPAWPFHPDHPTSFSQCRHHLQVVGVATGTQGRGSAPPPLHLFSFWSSGGYPPAAARRRLTPVAVL